MHFDFCLSLCILKQHRFCDVAFYKKKTRTKKEVFVENKNDEVVETKSNEIIEKKELCKVRYDGGFMYISFKGYGLALPNDKGHKENELYVYYSGEIGSPNFKFRI